MAQTQPHRRVTTDTPIPLAAPPWTSTSPAFDLDAPRSIRSTRLVARAPSPRFLAAAGSVLALVLTLFSAFESVSSRDLGPLWHHFGVRLAIDYVSLLVVVFVVLVAKVATPERLYQEPPAARAVTLSFAPYVVAGVLGGVARYHLRAWLGVNWQVGYPWELWTNVGAGVLSFTLVGFIASQYHPLLERLERLRALSKLAEQAADIAAERDFRRRLDLADRHDEVGHLARTVNHLLSTVEGTLASHRDFLADTSHELRNPLLAIRVNLELASHSADPRAREDCVRESLQQVERMSRLVSDLLTLARLESGQILELRPVQLRRLLEEAVGEAAKRSRGQAIRLGEVTEATALADEGRLRQVLANLLDNAIRHTPPPGVITLGLGIQDGWARIEVVDTGDGIPPEHLPRVFDRFHQVGRATPDGAGLGLAIVKHLCEAHGGRATVVSEPGKGSRFDVWLPLHSRPLPDR